MIAINPQLEVELRLHKITLIFQAMQLTTDQQTNFNKKKWNDLLNSQDYKVYKVYIYPLIIINDFLGFQLFNTSFTYTEYAKLCQLDVAGNCIIDSN